MLISRHIRQVRRGALGGLAALAIAVGLPTENTLAEESDEFLLQFHSFVPAQKSFRLPTLHEVASWRGDMENARKAWRKGKYANARKHLENAREKGSVTAAWYLGHLYQQGRGVKKNDEAAFKYYREVALKYEPDVPIDRRLMIIVDARVRVADVYREGSKSAGVKRDQLRAYRIYRVASGHGHPGAEFGLGVMFLNGLGINKNPKRGLSWLSRAAGKRYAPAEALLGDLYWQGMYVPKDPTRAVMWYLLARQTASPLAHRHIFERLEVMLSKTNGEQHSKAQKWAGRWNKKYPARQGHLPVSN